MITTMRAAQLSEPGPVENLSVVELPLPQPEAGQVRIRVRAAGINRSELHTRLGLSEGVTFPRVLGIECAGTVDLDPAGELAEGRQVVAMMGGMGRDFDGGYAEYAVVPRANVIPFTSELPWETLGAIPETLQTAYGSLTTGLDLRAGQTLLIRGGTSALGLVATAIAKDMGATVLATTRSADRFAVLKEQGVDHPLLDDGNVAAQVRELYPDGVDAALELVGPPTLPDTLASVRVHGTVCFSGILSNEWIIPDFYPIGYLPKGVRLSGYGGGSEDLPGEVLQSYVDKIAAGTVRLGPVRAYPLAEIRRVHADLENNTGVGKMVVLP